MHTDANQGLKFKVFWKAIPGMVSFSEPQAEFGGVQLCDLSESIHLLGLCAEIWDGSATYLGASCRAFTTILYQ